MASFIIDFWKNVNENCKKFEHKCAAVCYNDEHILEQVTHHDLLQVSQSLDKELSRLKNTKNTCFGLLMEHNPYIPAILMSISKVNAAFMFLDVLSTKVEEMVSKLNIKHVLRFGKIGKQSTIENATSLATVIVDGTHEIQLLSFGGSEASQLFENINFVVQTSGTTGAQKVVKVEHDCILSNVNCLRKIFQLNENDVIYFGTNLLFDPSVIELYLAMITGACLLITSPKIKRNPSSLHRALFSSNLTPTFLQMCPSAFLRWTDAEIQQVLLRLKTLVLGGEPFPLKILQLPKPESLRIYNIYGITEVSCWASIYKVEGGESEIPLGLPLDDTIFEVRDERDCKIDNDGIGQLFIGSCRRFCLVDDEATKPNQFRPTGDRVLVAKNNRLYYKSRLDDVIKRYGCRVNLLSIEDAVFRETQLESKCVWLACESKLILFVKLAELEFSKKILDKLRVKLLHCLVKEAFPDEFQAISSFPLTRNGKINKKSLQMIAANYKSSDSKNSNLPQIFSSLWAKYLALDQLESDAYKDRSFYDLGGNSVLSAQFSTELREITQGSYSSDFFDYLFTNSYEDVCRFVAEVMPSNNNNNRKRKITEASDGYQILLGVKWKYNLQSCVDTSATVLKNDLVAVGAFSHIFAVVDLENGSEVFKVVLPDAVENECCPSACENFVYVGCYDGGMYCIGIPGGDVIWTYSTASKIKNKPCLVSENRSIVFGSYDKCLHCVDIQSGSSVWRTYLSESITSNPIYVKNYACVLVATIQGSCCCINEVAGEVLWTFKFNCPVFGSPCFAGHFVAWPGVQGTVRGICYQSGKELWKFQSEAHIYSSLTLYKNCVVFGCHDHNIYCVEPLEEKPTAKLVFKVTLDAPISTGCSVFKCNGGDYIVAATVVGNLFLIDPDGACVASKLSLGGQIFSAPVVAGNAILVGCRDNYLYCLIAKDDELDKR